jgi:protein TonB
MSSDEYEFENTARGEVLRWGLSFLVIVLLHGGGAMALLVQSERGEHSDATPVVMMDFVAPPSPAARAQDMAPGQEQVQSEAAPQVASDQAEPLEAEPITEAKPVRVADTEPVRDAELSPVKDAPPVESEQTRAQVEEPLPIPEVAAAPDPEVAVPVAAVPPPPTPAVKEETDPKQKKTVAPVTPSAAASVTTAPTIASVRNASLVSWKSRLATHLQRYKRYPAAARARREQGAAQVRFTVDRAGRVLSAGLVRGSGSSSLDEEAMAMIRRAQPLPRPPADVVGSEFNFNVPVSFSMQ